LEIYEWKGYSLGTSRFSRRKRSAIIGDAVWARLSWGRMKTPFGVMDDAPSEQKEAGDDFLFI
jgi:hypothetical protein